MEDIKAVCDLFPDQALSIKKLALQDPEFRSICNDLLVAQSALKANDRQSQISQERVEEFKQIVDDLRDELAEYLKSRDAG